MPIVIYIYICITLIVILIFDNNLSNSIVMEGLVLEEKKKDKGTVPALRGILEKNSSRTFDVPVQLSVHNFISIYRQNYYVNRQTTMLKRLVLLTCNFDFYHTRPFPVC